MEQEQVRLTLNGSQEAADLFFEALRDNFGNAEIEEPPPLVRGPAADALTSTVYIVALGALGNGTWEAARASFQFAMRRLHNDHPDAVVNAPPIIAQDDPSQESGSAS